MTPQAPDSRNLYVAVALCIGILILWEFFILGPQQKAERERLAALKKQQEQSQPATPGAANSTTSAPGSATAPALSGAQLAAVPRVQALLNSGTRVPFDTPSIDGSIALTGARIDNLMLKKYRETVDKKSPEITLLTPKGAELSYFAEFGWTGAVGTPLPGPATPWTLQGAAKLAPGSPITLSWDNGQGLRFTRIIAVDEHYMFTIADTVENSGTAAVSIYPYAIVQRQGLPKDHVPNWILHEGVIGVFEGSTKLLTYAEVADEQEVKVEGNGGWLGITDKYWLTALIPTQQEKIQGRFAAIPGTAATQYQADYLLSARTIAPGGKASVEHRFFAGAKERSRIQAYEEAFNIPRFHNAIDWGWFWFLTQPMAWMLEKLNLFFGNFGLAILALTVIVKALFFPLANRSYEAMSKLKKVQPELQQLQTTYKDDRLKLQTEMMALYRREKINPVMGCLPILFQIPVFFSLYKVLFVTIEMRHAPFYGWIQDLAAPDFTSIFNLFGLLPFSVPAWLSFGFIHIPLHIGVFAILMGVTMWIQTKMNPPAQDPMQQQVLNWMPWIFMVMLTTFPAGLMIYWVWNNILSIAQQYVIMRKNGTPIEIIDNFKMPAWMNRSTESGGPPDAKT